jgi:Conserved TM helix
MIQEIADALVQSWRNFADAFVLFVPRLVAATIIFAGGFVLSVLARRAVQRLLAWLNFDRFAIRTGASEMLRVADLPSAELLVAKIVFWIVWIGFIVSAVDTLQFGPFQGLVEQFFRFVPRFLVALLVLALGFLIGNFVWRATLIASVNAGLPAARLLSGMLRLLVIAIGVVMALEQLGFATAAVLTAFAIAFGALMLGLAIAFGLGGRDAARQLLEQHVKAKSVRPDTDAAPHL